MNQTRLEAEETSGDILLVDDNVANLVSIEVALGDFGGRVVRAQSGAEALRILLDRDFALILLDVNMPTLGGLETARMIRDRRRSRHTPIIFITAHGRDEQDVLAAYKLGAVDFLFKPIVAEVLQSKANVFVELQRRTAEVARQAAQLREHERREHSRALEEERRRWDEEAMRRQMVELAEADRRKDEFLAMLGHELRNPLSAIVVGSELMLRKLADATVDPAIHRTRERIARQAQHLKRLVDDLLDNARINSGKIQLRLMSVPIQQVIENAVTSSLPDIEARGHAFTIDVPQTPLMLFADPVRLTQVIANLLNNAARYTDAGGSIRLECRALGDTVQVQIADNGHGIDPQLLPRIFDMFVQERNDGVDRGLGLGLTIVKRLVTMHGGTVVATSPGTGQGATFILTLPLASAEEIAEAPGDTQETSPVGAAKPLHPPLAIVLVEDNEDIRDSMQELLTSLGHNVQVAPDGPSGLELILRAQPDLALVDVGLPELDGYEVAKQVRERATKKHIRLVAMTGFGLESDRQRSQQAGFDSHLVKPADMDALMDLLSPQGE